MHMPEMDGAMLAREMRRLRPAPQLPLVLLSSLGHREHASDGDLFAAYLTKPAKPSQIQDVLASLLKDDPRKPPTVHPFVAPVPPPTGGARRLDRLLLAEDNLVNQRVARALLSKRGYDVTVVDDGRKVLEAIRTSPFDLILMDVQMPELAGLAATKAIRDLEAKRRHGEQHSCNGEKSFQKSRIPIIAMTAHAMAGDQERCLAVDMDDYISKPFQPSELYSKIERLVRQRRNGEPAIC